MAGIFTISLDFELHWGGFEKWPLTVAMPTQSFGRLDNRQSPVSGYRKQTTYDQYFLNTRKIIPRLLKLFEQYGIHCTWATVGMLMHDKKEGLMQHVPERKPAYRLPHLSAYHYIEQHGIGLSEEDDPFHYAHSLVKQILRTPYQELGSHTFAHFYCNEPGQTSEQFRDDLKAARQSAEQFGIKLRSLVFPRNQFNDEYLKVCYEEGFTSVRSNPIDWFWRIESTQHESAWKRLNRGIDAYFPVGKKNTYSIDSINCRQDYPVLLPASRLLRPYRPKELFLNSLKVKRIRSEMQQAARDGEIYHLWWHPHNFGHHPEENLHALESILCSFSEMNGKHGMQSLNMAEVSSIVKNSV